MECTWLKTIFWHGKTILQMRWYKNKSGLPDVRVGLDLVIRYQLNQPDIFKLLQPLQQKKNNWFDNNCTFRNSD
jgi:hypothetical protein